MKTAHHMPSVLSLFSYVLKGAAFGVGALAIAKVLGPPVAREVGNQAIEGALTTGAPAARELAHDAGRKAGEGFGEGLAAARTFSNLVSGELGPTRGQYR